MKKIVVTCIAHNWQPNTNTVLVQFNVDGQQGGHQLNCSQEEAEQFKPGAKYTVTFDKA